VFAQLVIDLVRLRHPTVRDIHANPGDWGIDAFVGTLDEGESVLVWQSKFFIDGVTSAQQAQVRESFESCVTAAKREGYRISAWTLCIPESMDGPTTKWWEKWKKKNELDHDLAIELWEPAFFRELFRAPEAQPIVDDYFGSGSRPRPLDLEPVPAGETFDAMLFIKQLVAAQIDPEPAKYEFFNAELLHRETLDKSGDRGKQFLESVQEELFSMWSHRWDAHCAKSPAEPLLSGLHSEVMSAIEQIHAALTASDDVVPMRLTHRKGSMHQVVETGRAGWIRDFRQLAEEHGL
jgi:hypothetical protein